MPLDRKRFTLLGVEPLTPSGRERVNPTVSGRERVNPTVDKFNHVLFGDYSFDRGFVIIEDMGHLKFVSNKPLPKK